MRTLDDIAIEHHTDKSSLYHGYTEHYAKYFEPWRDRVSLLEIGVQFGHSIKTWLEYFGPESRIFGVDILQEFKSDDPRYQFFRGSGGDVTFWARIKPNLPALDIVIDDGSHKMCDIVPAFNELWMLVAPGGLYIIEDWFAPAYDLAFSSRPRARDWLESIVGALNWYGRKYHGKPNNPDTIHLTELESSLAFIHCYRGLIIMGKK